MDRQKVSRPHIVAQREPGPRRSVCRACYDPFAGENASNEVETLEEFQQLPPEAAQTRYAGYVFQVRKSDPTRLEGRAGRGGISARKPVAELDAKVTHLSFLPRSFSSLPSLAAGD